MRRSDNKVSVDRHADGRTDRQTDRRTDKLIPIYSLQTLFAGGIMTENSTF